MSIKAISLLFVVIFLSGCQTSMKTSSQSSGAFETTKKINKQLATQKQTVQTKVGNSSDIMVEKLVSKGQQAQRASTASNQPTNTKALVVQNAVTTVTDQETEHQAKEGQFFLPHNLFSLSEDDIVKTLQPIIDKVAKDKSEIAIYWPNDKEARLLYQIINSRVSEFRVRAMTYHRSDYMVELQQD